MKRILIGFAASAAVLSLSAGAFACAKLDTAQSTDTNNKTIILAQAATGGSTGGPAVSEPEEKTIGGKRKTETDAPSAPAAPGTTDTSGSAGAVDASQSKRKDTTEPAQSGAK